MTIDEIREKVLGYSRDNDVPFNPIGITRYHKYKDRYLSSGVESACAIGMLSLISNIDPLDTLAINEYFDITTLDRYALHCGFEDEPDGDHQSPFYALGVEFRALCAPERTYS
jgi:hypothetical protein